MKLEGLHHITAITGDAPKNVDFYVRLLGMRLVKKTVNQDDPTVYHLFYGDEKGSPGFDLTFFEYPGVPQGRAGAHMVHEIGWRVGSDATLDFWEERLAGADVITRRSDDGLRFDDPEGLTHKLAVVDVPDQPLIARSKEVPEEHALQGFDGVRAYNDRMGRSDSLLADVLGFESKGENEWEQRGDERGSYYVYDDAPEAHGLQGGGTVHHIAWGSRLEDQDAWRERLAGANARPTPVIDRFYFRSIYFREPSGVLF
jgi:glyoxalase family protein